eukprot:CAMPEP_0174949088 /NCGR_PEP_ID=MMETSP1355-20121228/90653_1 /TAXON_ID=464990 /ORGANISM="Hemiselmis tepida, Strain CCMP443" /LENGTH=66 /DNA_ID=CAMNT_0016196627 /DNA_START=238 /DNA_END=435 /DNA_ORIENTATION=-
MRMYTASVPKNLKHQRLKSSSSFFLGSTSAPSPCVSAVGVRSYPPLYTIPPPAALPEEKGEPCPRS